MELERIANREFYVSKYQTLFYDNETNRSFGKLALKEGGWKFGWRSSGVSPILKKITDEVYCIGIDQDLAVVNVTNLRKLRYLKLDFFLLEIEVFGEFVFVMTELEILKLEKVSFNVVATYQLPDNFVSIDFSKPTISILCSDGTEIII